MMMTNNFKSQEDSAIQYVEANGTMHAQAAAIHHWGTMRPAFNLNEITQPVMIVNGSSDEMLHTFNSYKLFQGIPGALLSLYPDAAHGFLFQYPNLFTEQCTYFLDNDL